MLRHSCSNLIYCSFCVDSRDYKTSVRVDLAEIAEETACIEKPTYACSEEFALLATRIMDISGWSMPTNAESAKDLYINLIQFIDNL